MQKKQKTKKKPNSTSKMRATGTNRPAQYKV